MKKNLGLNQINIRALINIAACFILFFSLAILADGAVYAQADNTGAPASEINTDTAVNPVSTEAEVKDPAGNTGKTEVSTDVKSQPGSADSQIGIKDTRQAGKDDAVMKAAVKKDEVPAVSKDTDGLLNITEGSFKYRRIPDIKIPDDSDDTDSVKNNSISGEVITGADNDSAAGEDGKKGIFGVSKKTGDTVIIVILVVIILGVIIALLFKSKGKDDNVLRRFPRA